MPTTLNDDASSFPSAITVPLGSDPRTDVSVETPFQQVANRTANLKSRLDGIAPTTRNGVSALYRVPSDAALLAIGAADHTDKVVCLVDDLGLYEYEAASVLPALGPFVRQPNDVPPGAPGRWILVAAGYGVLGAANGLAQADGTGRTPAAGVRNGVVIAQAVQPPLVSTSVVSPNWFDVPGSLITLPGLLAGDLVFADYGSSVLCTPTTVVNSQLLITLPSGLAIQSLSLSGAAVNLLGTTSSGLALPTCTGVYTVTQPGTHTLKLQINVDAATHNGSLINPSLRVLVIRP